MGLSFGYGFSLVAQLVKNVPAMQETLVQFLGQEDPLEKGRLPTPVFLGFPGGSAGKESACNAGNLGSIPGLRRSPGEGQGYPLQYSGLENSMDCTVYGVAKSQTRLSNIHFRSYIGPYSLIIHQQLFKFYILVTPFLSILPLAEATGEKNS